MKRIDSNLVSDKQFKGGQNDNVSLIVLDRHLKEL